MKKGGKEVKEKRVTSLLGEDGGETEAEAGDDLSQVGFDIKAQVFMDLSPKDFGRDHG